MYDIIVFGASGFTGQHVVAALQSALRDPTNLKVAIAGRSQAKLERVLQRFGSPLFDVRPLPSPPLLTNP